MLHMFSLSDVDLARFSADARWRKYLELARANGRKLYVLASFGSDVDHAFEAVTKWLWRAQLNRLLRADPSLSDEERAEIVDGTGWTIPENEPIYLDPLQAQLGEYVDAHDLASKADSVIRRAVEAMPAAIAGHLAALKDSAEKLKTGETDQAAHAKLQDAWEQFRYNGERDMYKAFAREAAMPRMRAFGGFAVIDPTSEHGQVIDFLTSADGGMRSIREGHADFISGEDHHHVGRNGKETLSFLKGAYVLIGPGSQSKAPGVLYAGFALRHTAADGITVKVFGSREAAEGYRQMCLEAARTHGSSVERFDEMVATEITDALIQGFGTKFHSSHMEWRLKPDGTPASDLSSDLSF